MKPSVVKIASMSPPSRGAWIEIKILENTSTLAESPPSRGAWIEMILL